MTIAYFPACRAALPPERHTFSRLFYQAIEDGVDGHVLVLASNGYTDASLGGGAKLSRVQNHRLAGILADGRCVISRARALRPGHLLPWRNNAVGR